MNCFSKKLLMLLLAAVLVLCAGAAVAETTHSHVYVINPSRSVTPTCTQDGYTYYECTACGDYYTVTIPAVGHKPGDTVETVITNATCGATGTKRVVVYCKHCGMEISNTVETIPATGNHTRPTDWTVIREATCTTDGYRVKNCTVCGTLLESETIPAGHKFGAWTTVAVTCTTDGYDYRTCSVCGYTEYRNQVACPGSHLWDGGTVTVAATCTQPGVTTYTCLRCQATRTEQTSRKGHTWGPWNVDIQPTCTERGHRWHTCTVCHENHDEAMQPLGHSWSEWVVVRQATAFQAGEEQRTCSNCGKVEKRDLPYDGSNAAAGGGATMCVYGPRLKDVGTYLDPAYTAWYMFTPFDASVDGRQTYELVVDDAYIVGTATITVENGNVTLDYDLNTPYLTVDLEFFSFLPDMHVLTQYEPEELKARYGMETGVPYSIASRFGGDTNLVLYFCSRVTYSYDAATMSPLNYMSTYHQALLSQMLLIMD